MRRHLYYLLVTFLVLSSCKGNETDPITEDESIDTIPMMVMQIQKCSKLYTAEYHVHKIVTHDDELTLKGSVLRQDIDIDIPIGKRKVAIPMDATIKAYIDFGTFSEKNVRRHGEKIELTLPDPKVTMTSTKIDHEGVKQYVALFREKFTDEELTAYEQKGRKAIIRDIPKMGIIETARESAARILIPMIVDMGFKEENITITFRKDKEGNTLSTSPTNGKG